MALRPPYVAVLKRKLKGYEEALFPLSEGGSYKIRKEVTKVCQYVELISSKQRCPGIAYIACLAPPDMFFM